MSSLLRCVIEEEFDDKHIGEERDELKDILYQSLYGRRYMIVLDDIWNIKFWDEIRMYFPDNDNGSRIVITTRESDVARYADSLSVQHQVQLLGESASWNLLRQIVFGEAEEDCTDELQGIGEKIASDCGGLPLDINVIGGVLSKVERSLEAWEKIGKDVRAAMTESDEQFSNILTLSYDHLPNHLKPCFLYMAAFPEDYQIMASKLVRLWVAEGFVKSSNNNKSLEEEAEDYLKALVGRNLVSVKENNYYYKGKKAKRYNVHDLLRDLCIRKGEYTIEFVHKNLQTLSRVHVTDKLISIGFFNSIPNIRDLGIEIDDMQLRTGVVDLSRLHKLRTLRCSSLYSERVLMFPSNLHLFHCTARGKLLTALCALPNLELLEIRYCGFERKEDSEGEEWEMKEGDEFRSLRFLQLNECKQLVRWRADETKFPRLRRLVLQNCHRLEEIPSGMGEIPTLQCIEVCKCSDSVVESAQRIVEEQQSEYGNYHLRLHETYYS